TRPSRQKTVSMPPTSCSWQTSCPFRSTSRMASKSSFFTSAVVSVFASASPSGWRSTGMPGYAWGIAMGVLSGLRGISPNIAANMEGALAVQEGSGVVDRLPERLAVQGIGGGAALGLQSVHQMIGRVLGGNVLDAQLGELLVVNEDVPDATCVAAALGHDDPFRVGTSHDRLSLLHPGLMGLNEGSNVAEGPLSRSRALRVGWRTQGCGSTPRPGRFGRRRAPTVRTVVA